jgi:hypothetical protein
VSDGESDRSAHDILASYGSTAEAAEKTRAEDFLRTALAGGPHRTTDVQEEAKQIHGIAKRTLERARGTIRIPPAQRPAGQPRNKDGPAAAEWWIALPEHEGDLAGAGPDRQRPPPGAPSRRASQHRPPVRQPPSRLADSITSQTEANAPTSASSATAASPRKPAGGPKARPAPTPTPPHDHDHHHQGESR